MLKMVVGIVLFATLALFVIIKGGASLDMVAGKRDDATAPAPAEAASSPASVGSTK